MTRLEILFVFFGVFVAIMVSQLLENDIFPREHKMRIELIALAILGMIATLILGLAGR